jgi:2-desacetyl-2-hydroxyethyl bacteriochlorophyllide A dehydrogenase
VIVRVAATAICHTDLEIYTGRHPGVQLPRVMGHEATGIIESVAPDVERVAIGQRVVINPIIACGTCDCCARGDDNLCRRAGLLGRELDGSLAEHVRLPAQYVHPLPGHLELGTATLIETLATVRHAQQRVHIARDDAVVVLGAGATGLLHIQLAKLTGARLVIALSRSAWKLDLARRMRADHASSSAGADAVAEVLRLTGGHGADVVIDSAGDPALLVPAMAMLRPGGRLLAYAISHVAVPGFTTFPLYFKELTLYGSRALMPDDLDEAIRLVASGTVVIGDFITSTYPLDRVAAAFEDYEQDPGRVLRMLVVQA